LIARVRQSASLARFYGRSLLLQQAGSEAYAPWLFLS
jgi:hypothetical protein